MILPGALVDHWTANPAVVGGGLLLFALWVRGRRWLLDGSRAAHETNGARAAWQDRPWSKPAFVAALVAMMIAACSPIDAFAAELFWVHMVQHLILLMVVAPLIVVAAPWLPLWYGLPVRWRGFMSTALRTSLRGNTARPSGRIWAFWSLLAFVLGTWIWHWPALYDIALQHDVLHDYGEHNTFLAIGILFWLQVLPSAPCQPLLGIVGRGVFLLGAIVQNVLLSLVLGFAPHPLYAPYAALAQRPGGISALTDQQLGAALMWSIGDLPFVLGLVGVVHVWLRQQMPAATPRDDGIRPTAGEPST